MSKTFLEVLNDPYQGPMMVLHLVMLVFFLSMGYLLTRALYDWFNGQNALLFEKEGAVVELSHTEGSTTLIPLFVGSMIMFMPHRRSPAYEVRVKIVNFLDAWVEVEPSMHRKLKVGTKVKAWCYTGRFNRRRYIDHVELQQ